MSRAPTFDCRVGLFTDLYELTMVDAYLQERLTGTAVFTLFARRLPPSRQFLLACGLATVLQLVEGLRFTSDDIAYLRSLDRFSDECLEWLLDFRFTGDVRAVAEGTPVFANEPILEVVAPLPQAQLIETLVMNQIHLQTLLASKAVRVVRAAAGRTVVDFGARRMHGRDAALLGARAYHVAGIDATSNVLAGQRFGIPVAGTLAHSYIQAHDDERDALRRFAKTFPGTILLVDTYDTLEGVRHVIDLMRADPDGIRVNAIRLDSGDLLTLARQSRDLLDAAGLRHVDIFASSDLDEHEIAGLVRAGAPIGGFGVGTAMGVSQDAPALDIVYKLTEYAGVGRTKLSRDKPVLPGRTQLFRYEEHGKAVADVIARAGEMLPARDLLQPVMSGGQIRSALETDLHRIRQHAAEETDRLPAHAWRLEAGESRYPVQISDALEVYHAQVRERIASTE